MTQTRTKPMTFAEFLQQYPEDGKIYELVNGEIVEMRATRAHDKVADFINKRIDREIDRLELDLIATGRATVRVLTKTGQEQGRNPDVSVIDAEVWDSDLDSYTALEKPIPLAVEVASTNWRDDYIEKLDEYRRLGIREYWIVDYLAVASAQYIGQSKVPTVSVYCLVDGEYRATQFRGNERIISATFPELAITVAEVVAASRPRGEGRV